MSSQPRWPVVDAVKQRLPDREDGTATLAEAIAPDDFLDRYPEADTLRGALRLAEMQPSTTPRWKRPRCPNKSCLSCKIRFKNGYDVEQRKDPDYVCTACRNHFSTPLKGREVFFAENPIMSDELKATAGAYRFPTGDDLQQIREALGLKPNELEAVSAVTPSTHRNTERGRRSPRLQEVRAFLAFFRVVDGVRRAERLADELPDEVAELEDVEEGRSHAEEIADALPDDLDDVPEEDDATETDEDDGDADAFVWTASEDLAAPEDRPRGVAAGGVANE